MFLDYRLFLTCICSISFHMICFKIRKRTVLRISNGRIIHRKLGSQRGRRLRVEFFRHCISSPHIFLSRFLHLFLACGLYSRRTKKSMHVAVLWWFWCGGIRRAPQSAAGREPTMRSANCYGNHQEIKFYCSIIKNITKSKSTFHYFISLTLKWMTNKKY